MVGADSLEHRRAGSRFRNLFPLDISAVKGSMGSRWAQWTHPHAKRQICSGALASSMVGLACARQGCPIICVWRCAPVVRFAAPPLTGAGEPKTWLVRFLRRDCWPEFLIIKFNRSGQCIGFQCLQAVHELI